LGAATADAIYSSIAGFGLTVISSALVNHSFELRLIGGLFLCYLGIKTILAKPAAEAAAASKSKGLIATYLSTVFLTLTNPATIMAFVAIFAGLGLAGSSDYASAAVLVTGVFLGSALWWLLLSSSASLLRSHFNPRHFKWLNRISGAILLVFGIISLSSIR
jgi:threonine/homoserine/homoserine lactone efflux protein